MKKKIEFFMVICILFAAGFLAREGAVHVLETKAETKPPTIVVDAGHGGIDPGKVGVNDVLEKDLNLAIALKLKEYLEAQDIAVALTRDGDSGLYDEDTKNKKVEDLRRRCELIEDTMPVFTVSIHQNSYPEEYVKGAQVFYFGQSEEGKVLAELLQKTLKEELDPENNREAKANESYYLLKKTPTPTVIVECGFLSNYEEAEKLTTEEYQSQVAWAVCMGIMKYLNLTE